MSARILHPLRLKAANDQIEAIRRLTYTDVGVVGGNPPGVLAATKTINADGVIATVQISINYVNFIGNHCVWLQMDILHMDIQ